MPEIDLTGLKALHYPITPSWWPLAWGWYVVLAGVFCLGFIIIYRRRNSALAYANREIKKIQKLPTDKQLKLLSQLLKRVAMVRYGREAIAPLSEDTWQEFLLASAPEVLTQEQAQKLAYAIYNPQATPPNNLLFSNCQKWIQKVLKKSK